MKDLSGYSVIILLINTYPLAMDSNLSGRQRHPPFTANEARLKRIELKKEEYNKIKIKTR